MWSCCKRPRSGQARHMVSPRFAEISSIGRGQLCGAPSTNRSEGRLGEAQSPEQSGWPRDLVTHAPNFARKLMLRIPSWSTSPSLVQIRPYVCARIFRSDISDGPGRASRGPDRLPKLTPRRLPENGGDSPKPPQDGPKSLPPGQYPPDLPREPTPTARPCAACRASTRAQTPKHTPPGGQSGCAMGGGLASDALRSYRAPLCTPSDITLLQLPEPSKIGPPVHGRRSKAHPRVDFPKLGEGTREMMTRARFFSWITLEPQKKALKGPKRPQKGPNRIQQCLARCRGSSRNTC